MERNVLAERELAASLGAESPWLIRCFDLVSSTMDVARECAVECAVGQPLICIAKSQSAGRGRQGRSWNAAESGAHNGDAAGLYATCVFDAPLDLRALSGFSLAIGVGLAEAFDELGVRVMLKWPNDLYAPDMRKIGGVLIENHEVDRRSRILVGFGVNVCGVPAGVSNAAALTDLVGWRIDRMQFAVSDAIALAVPALWSCWKEFIALGFEGFRERWLGRTVLNRRKLEIDGGNTVGGFSGEFAGLDGDGCLLLNSINAGGTKTLRRVVAGHVTAIH